MTVTGVLLAALAPPAAHSQEADGTLGHILQAEVVVTHEMDFARRVADRVVFIDEGSVLDNCTKEQVFTDSEGRSERARDFVNKILVH